MASVRSRPARRISFRAQGNLVFLVAATCAAPLSQATPLVSGLPETYFPIGVYYQPARASGTTSLTGWKARGINTLIGWERQAGDSRPVSIDEYSAAAVAAGLYMIREPRANPTDDAGQANLIAFLQPDEPEGNGVPASTIQANYAAWKAAVPTMPVVANFEGGSVIGWQNHFTQATYASYLQGADIAAEDIYPITGWLVPNQLSVVGQTVDRLRSYSADPLTGQTKPVIVIIETSNQRLFANSHPDWAERGVTPGEFREQVWDALIHGANGIVYFSQSFSAFRYDATPIDVAAEMTKQNATINSLAPVLNSHQTPDVASVTLTGAGLESMIRSYNGVTYLFILNQSNATVAGTFAAMFSNAGDGLNVVGEDRTLLSSLGDGMTFSDTFAPFAVHIYAEGPAGTSPLAIVSTTPEPSSALLAMGVATATLITRRPRRLRTI